MLSPARERHHVHSVRNCFRVAPTTIRKQSRSRSVNADDKAGPILKMTLPDLLQLWLVEQSNTFQSPQWLCRRHDPRTASSGR